ncbi:rhamnan synthesis F family protein [Cribrihabitans neustonicus]|uniref:rhamnan synthesis F family protein n=1 Tax=Cribrihabitans neustonicus TaxID=1429085 RepID=UPI003B5BBCAA
MKMLPLWKIARELRRVLEQLPRLPGQISSYFLGARYYDRFHAPQVKVIEGNLPGGSRVAIYLVFPRDGLLPSHKHALEYLRENGYAPLVVSNLPVSGADAEYLKENAWRVIERPNVGYDFGGYRDGVLSLAEKLSGLERLVLLNDSSWFPLPGSRNWLKEAEGLGVDYAAAATSLGIVRVKPSQYQSIQWTFDPTQRNFHYGSYAVSLGPALLRDKRFQRYWTNYPLTKEKNKVVRRGEIGLTRFVVKNGFSHAATYDILRLPDDLRSLSDEEVNWHARNLTLLDDRACRETASKAIEELDAERSQEDREHLIKLIMAVVARIGVSYTLPHYLYEKHGFTFLKKSLASISKQDSDITYELAKRLGGEGAFIREEIEEIRRRCGYS